jgi:type I restriction enzyme S subunit
MELPVPVPPDLEQSEILAKVQIDLEKLDCVVRKTERSIELLKEHRSALITAAVTGQIDLRDTAVAVRQLELRETA